MDFATVQTNLMSTFHEDDVRVYLESKHMKSPCLESELLSDFVICFNDSVVKKRTEEKWMFTS